LNENDSLKQNIEYAHYTAGLVVAQADMSIFISFLLSNLDVTQRNGAEYVLFLFFISAIFCRVVIVEFTVDLILSAHSPISVLSISHSHLGGRLKEITKY